MDELDMEDRVMILENRCMVLLENLANEREYRLRLYRELQRMNDFIIRAEPMIGNLNSGRSITESRIGALENKVNRLFEL